MAIYRNIHLTFWEDSKIYDNFTPEDKFFYLWILTNPKTNLIGCYEISLKKSESEIGYTKDIIENLLQRLVEHKSIRYDSETKEVLIINWHKYNWTKSIKLDKPLKEGISKIKNNEFREYLIGKYNLRNEKEIPYTYPIDTTVTVTDTDTITDTDLIVQDIFDFWNNLDIIKHSKLTADRYKLINKAIKEHGKDNLMEFMTRYKTILEDPDDINNYSWKLEVFLKQKNALPEFTDEGSKWISYDKKKNKKSNSNGVKKPFSFIDIPTED